MASLRRSARIRAIVPVESVSETAAAAAAAPPAQRAVSRKRKARPATPPPSTPPAALPPATPQTPRPRHFAVSRLANPDVSNAMLVSPETSRVVSVLPPPASQSSAAASATTTTMTTTSILDEACAHLVRVDPRMKKLIDAHYCTPFSPAALAEQVDPFESLASGIISQQVSGAAARAIKGRFVELFRQDSDEQGGNRTFPQPSQVAAMSIETLRTAGLSQRKAEYLQGLGAQFASRALTAQMLAEAPYDALVERLLAVRGLGLWSVEMFAVFGLKRLDVFSVGDLGVQRGMAAYAGRDIAKLKRGGGSSSTASSSSKKKSSKWKYMTDTEMLAMAEPFRPYRSVFMWYMWQVESVDVSTMG